METITDPAKARQFLKEWSQKKTGRTDYRQVKKIPYNGFTFDSKAEFERYLVLLLDAGARKISQLKVHPRFEIIPKEGKKRALYYSPDFLYIENGRYIAEDVKGFETQVFKLKARIFQNRYPEIIFKIIKA